MKIIHTDNFDGDYPNEKFVEGLPLLRILEQAQAIADAINNVFGPNADRFYKVVPDDYALQPGFQP